MTTKGNALPGQRETQAIQRLGILPSLSGQCEQKAGRLRIVPRLDDRFVERLDQLVPVVDGFLLGLLRGQTVGESAVCALPGTLGCAKLWLIRTVHSFRAIRLKRVIL